MKLYSSASIVKFNTPYSILSSLNPTPLKSKIVFVNHLPECCPVMQLFGVCWSESSKYRELALPWGPFGGLAWGKIWGGGSMMGGISFQIKVRTVVHFSLLQNNELMKSKYNLILEIYVSF